MFKKLKKLSNLQIVIIGLMLCALILTIVLVAYGINQDQKALRKAQSAGTIVLTEYPTVTNAGSVPTQSASEAVSAETTAASLKDPTAGGNYITTSPSLSSGTPSSGKLEDASKWSREEILTRVTNAVNNTKNYRGRLQVGHKESFTANITECTGGALVKTVAQTMMGWVVKPVDETLSYNNGTAVNTDGETVVILLPKRGPFCLKSEGVTAASAKVKNNEYVVNLKIVREQVGTYDIPPHNAASIGYLDVASMDLSLIKVNTANITYLGSTLEIHFNAENRVTYAEYHIPLHVSGEGSGAGINGSMVFDGEQTEHWTFNW